MSLTNTQIANNLISLLEKAKNNESLDEHPNPKLLFNKMVNMAINDKTILVIKTTKTENTNTEKKLTAYQQFIKDKMKELKNSEVPSKELFKKIAQMWKEHKLKQSEEIKEEPKKLEEPKKSKKPKKPKKV